MHLKRILVLIKKNILYQRLLYSFFVLTFFLIYFSPFLIKGENAFIDSHDNLDSINLLGVFDGSFKGNFFPTEENPQYALPGIDQKYTLRNISFEKLLIFLFGFFYGYLLNEIIFRLIAFGGMILIIDKIKGRYQFPMIFQILLALSFSSLPFYSQVNLTIAGLPMLVVSFLNLFHSMNKVKSYFFLILFGFYSSFVLIGIFIGIIIIFILFYLLITNKSKRWILYGGSSLLLSYLISHYNLFLNILYWKLETNRSVISALYFAQNTNALEQFLNILYNNQSHAVTNHALIILPSIFVLILENYKYSRRKKLIITCLSYIFCSAIIVGLSYYANFVGKIGPIGGFTWNRFYWVNPLLWYVLWAVVLIEMYQANKLNINFLFSILLISIIHGIKIYPNNLLAFFIAILIIVYFLNRHIKSKEVKNSLIIHTLLIMQILLNSYGYTYRAWFGKPSFKDFFSKEQFNEIIIELDLDKNLTRIGCIGFYPSVANYNGIKTLGAYENIYPLEFKNTFYEIIKDEIKKDEYLYNYFTKWGNRLYLFDNDIGKPYYDQQSKIKLHCPEITCDLNTVKMQELGTTHIFSTSKIKNYIEKNLNLLYISKKRSYFYDLYVYKIKN